MRLVRRLTVTVLLTLGFASTALAGVQLAIRDGRVTILAANATAAEILAEWARVGGMTVVNMDQAPRERMTIELRDVNEERALSVVLRHGGGYVAVRRVVAVADGSVFDRVLLSPRVAPRVVANAANGNAAPATAATASQTGVAQPAAAAIAESATAVSTAANTTPPEASQQQSASDQSATGEEPVQETPTTSVVLTQIPMTDPQTQAALKTRRALEVVDPKTFDFKLQPVMTAQPTLPPKKSGGQ